MELKTELIKHTITYLHGYLKYLVIDSNNNPTVPKLILKIITKEYTTPTNISFICPSSEYFETIMPGQKDNIKIGTPYSLGAHKLLFYIYDKSFIKNPPTNSDFLIFYPFDNLKEKDIVKFCEKNSFIKKVIAISKTCEKPKKNFGQFSPSFFSLKPHESYTYYNSMMQKLNDIK